MYKILFVIIAVSAAVIIVVNFFTPKTVPEVLPTVTVTASTSPTAAQSGEVKTYTSDKLGISFQYILTPEEGITVNTKESGNKVYVYVGTTAPESGQFVEVFTKKTDETFEASVRRQILAGFPSPDCKVVVTPSNIQSGYQVAEITYPKPVNREPWFANAKLCNEKYAQTNGMRYFLYDPKHPSKFAYLDIGQYGILGHDQVPWQYTLTFTK